MSLRTLPEAVYFDALGDPQLLGRSASVACVSDQVLAVCSGCAEHFLELAVLYFLLWGLLELILFISHGQYPVLILHVEVRTLLVTPQFIGLISEFIVLRVTTIHLGHISNRLVPHHGGVISVIHIIELVGE